jgi:signal transduction histidine kinase
VFAVAGGVAAAALAGAAVAGVVVTGVSRQEAVAAYLVTNLAIGAAYPVCGVVLAAARPRNPVGWLFLAAGLGHLATAALTPWPLGDRPWRGWPVGDPVAGTVLGFAWPWSIGVLLPLALQLFPDGRTVGRPWRVLAAGTILFGSGFAVVIGLTERSVPTLLRADVPTPVWGVINAGVLIAYVGTVASLVVRYRRSGEAGRRQLLWLVLALLVILVINAQRWLTGDGPILLLLTLPLIPIAVTVAILRYHVLDIRLVVSRTVSYAVLTALVVGGYAALVAGLDALLRGAGAPLLATLLVAIAFNPVRLFLQRTVDRAMYGSRSDPVRAIATIGERLHASDSDGLAGVPRAVVEALRLPYAAVLGQHGPAFEAGQAPDRTHRLQLRYEGQPVGALVVGLRAGERSLARADAVILELLTTPVAAALHATALSAELVSSRGRIVSAREEERRRLHRDLHDGLGPILTGAAFKADAAANLVPVRPDDAVALLGELRGDIRTAIDGVRHAVLGLRPPALDELGLVGALRRHAETLPVPAGVTAADLPPLPAAVEVAAYRIATEALTNVVRHAAAGRACVEFAIATGTVEAGGLLRLCVTDDGARRTGWTAGVGLASIRERVAELGGWCDTGPTPQGGRVIAELPLGRRR